MLTIESGLPVQAECHSEHFVAKETLYQHSLIKSYQGKDLAAAYSIHHYYSSSAFGFRQHHWTTLYHQHQSALLLSHQNDGRSVGSAVDMLPATRSGGLGVPAALTAMTQTESRPKSPQTPGDLASKTIRTRSALHQDCSPSHGSIRSRHRYRTNTSNVSSPLLVSRLTGSLWNEIRTATGFMQSRAHLRLDRLQMQLLEPIKFGKS